MSGDFMTSMNPDTFLGSFMRGVLAKTLLAGCIAGGLVYMVWSKSAAFGLMVGTLISMLNFYLMYRDASEFRLKSNRSAGRFITWRFFLRYGIMCGYLAVIALKTTWSPVAACIGLLSVQAVILAQGMARALGKPGRLGI